MRHVWARASVPAALGLALLAASVRLPTLAHQSFWLDEAYTEHLVRLSFGGMLKAIPASESTPPLYYILAWGWTRAWGYSEFGIRSLSAAAGILTVPVVYAAGTRLAGRKAGLIAGALVALAPLMVWYSQEARAYALAALLSGVMLLCFVSFIDDEHPRWLVGWAISSSLGLATHYFVAFVLLPQLMWLLWAYRRDRSVVLAAACTVAVALALTPLALAQRGTGHADYLSRGDLGTRLLQLPKQLLVGYASPVQIFSSALAAVLVLAGARALLDRAGFRRRARAPLAIAIAGVSAPILLALGGADFLNTRNLLPALPPLYVFLAIAFSARAPSGTVLGAALGLVLLAVLALQQTHRGYQRDDWRGVSGALGPATRQRAILVSPGSGQLPLGLYQPDLVALKGRTRVSEVDLVAIPVRTIGSGLAPPARPQPAQALPGFRLTDVARRATYTVLRLRATSNVPVSAASLSSLHLGQSSFAVLLQATGSR